MIVTDFYPTADTQAIDLLTTGTVTSLSLTDKDVDPAAAYYMGAVDNEASLFKYGTFNATKSGEDVSTYSYKFEQDTSKWANWFYMYATTGQYFGLDYGNGKWWSNFKFFNGFAPYKMNMNYGATITIRVRLYTFDEEHTLGNGEHVFTNSHYWNTSFTLSGDELFEFFDGTLTKNVTIGGVSYALTYSGFSDTNYCWDFGNGVRVYVTGASFPDNSNNSTYYNSTYLRCDVINGFALPEDGKYSNSSGTSINRPCAAVFSSTYALAPAECRLDIDTHKLRSSPGLYDNASMFSFNGDNNLLLGGKPFELSYIAARYATNNSNKWVLTPNGDVIKATGSDQIRINEFLGLHEIYRCGWGNCTKHTTSKDKDGNTVSGYTANTALYEKYQDVPLFSPNNVLLFRTKEDKYKDLEPVLQPWQKYGYDITDNDFDPEGSGDGGTGDPDDPSDPSKEDGIDEGSPNPPAWYSSNYSMTKFVNLNGAGWTDLKTNLQQAIVDTVNNPSDTTKLGYLLGTFKSDGTYECADDLSVFKFIASARWYPFDVSALFMGNNTYVVNQTPEATLTFGYRGASVLCSNKRVNWPIAVLETVTIQVPNKKGTTEISDCTFEDFEPYTKYTLMLPFVGELAIPAHNAVCATLIIKYIVDFSSGTCCAVVYSSEGFNSAGGTGATCVGILSGQCSTSVSVAGNDAVAQGDQIAAATLNKASTELSLARSKFDFGVTIAKTGINMAEGAMSASDKGFSGGIGAAQEAIKATPGIVHSAMDIAANNISDKMASIQLTQAQRSVPFCMNWGSNVTGNLFMETPTLRIERSLIIRPENYKHVYGYPTCKQFNLSGIKGYFQCANPDISGIGASGTVPTETEQQMINEALRTGSFMGVVVNE